mmetsp:Transcript_44989/g.104102  ORF Transcript_44989/g.104102 Transcript_44989/m.104102 type:complete len:227 (+) Transcript_44989:5643-6323(+)
MVELNFCFPVSCLCGDLQSLFPSKTVGSAFHFIPFGFRFGGAHGDTYEWVELLLLLKLDVGGMQGAEVCHCLLPSGLTRHALQQRDLRLLHYWVSTLCIAGISAYGSNTSHRDHLGRSRIIYWRRHTRLQPSTWSRWQSSTDILVWLPTVDINRQSKGPDARTLSFGELCIEEECNISLIYLVIDVSDCLLPTCYLLPLDICNILLILTTFLSLLRRALAQEHTHH